MYLSGVRSTCLSHPAAARRCCGFAAVSPVDRIDQLLHGRRPAATAPQQWRSAECGQFHVVS